MESINQTSIVFDESFKAKIRQIKETGIHTKLGILDIQHIIEIQDDIRQYLKTNYPSLVKNMPDSYATFICLITDIDKYQSWEDFKNILNVKIPYLYDEVRECACCCGHGVHFSNTTIVENDGLYLALGDVCINKTGIVCNFDNLLKKKKLMKKPIPKRKKKDILLQRKIHMELFTKTHCSKCFQFSRKSQCYDCIEAQRTQVERQLQESKRLSDSCSLCGKYCPKFKKCFECKLKTEDKCNCGKWKSKTFEYCYDCNKKSAVYPAKSSSISSGQYIQRTVYPAGSISSGQYIQQKNKIKK